MMYKYLLVLVLFSISCSGQGKIYKVKKINKKIIVTGIGTDEQWIKANVLTDFSYPWQKEDPPLTEFKSLWSDTHFYFLYTVVDHKIITPEKGLGDYDVVNSDRVEIFFKSTNEKAPYYSLEMDALGRCLDTEGFFNQNVDFKWNWPKEHFVLKATLTDTGYIVEGSITLDSLKKLGIYKNDGVLHAGLYRGEYFKNSDTEIGVKWISWVKPATKSFHVPSSFGTLKLLD